jgi:hypothetical protein
MRTSPLAMGRRASNMPRVGFPVMNDLSAQKPAATVATATPPAKPPVDAKALARALAGIQNDSQRQPETYLRDTDVPYGGE